MSDKDKDKDKGKDALKITNQARAKGGMEYDFKCEGVRMTLLITPKSTETDLGEWRIEARASRSPEAAVVTGWGPTRIEALRALGRAWTSKLPTHGLPAFDWEVVAQALLEVRAL